MTDVTMQDTALDPDVGVDPGVDLDFDPEELREKYRRERERRLNPEGRAQYRPLDASVRSDRDLAADPWVEPAPREALTDRVEVLIIGGGFGGLLAGSQLRRAGFESVRIVDRAGGFGGTWHWNRYPGIHCDIESYVYMPLLEEVGHMPSWRYAPGEEIRQHAVAIAEHYGLDRDALFHTSATGLDWDDEREEWHVSTDCGDHIRARFIVVASGTLSEPKLPRIPGIETFGGHIFHTSRWDYDYTGGDQTGGMDGLADKRVAVVGTGATGLQSVPHLAEDAGHLYVFQRTPSTVDVRDNRPTDPEWAASLEPGWQRRRMEKFLARVSGEDVGEDLVRDGWTATARLQRQMITGAVDADLDATERERRDELADFTTMNRIRARVDQVVQDPETAEALKPWYRYMCKRPGFSDSYLQTFNRTDVTLVDTADHGGVTRMTERGIVVGGTEYDVECVVFATGFDVGVSGVVSGTLPVHGRGGTSLLQAWSQGPRSLHGVYTNGFPNLMHMGSLQNANSVNFVHILQEQAEHIASVLAATREAGARRVEPTADAEETWGQTIREVSADNSTFLAECTPGYYNGEGRRTAAPTSYSPGPVAFHRLLAEWRQTSMDEVLMVDGPAATPGEGRDVSR